jgi:hypothetical protein
MNKIIHGGAAALFAALLLSTSAHAQSECTGNDCPKPGAEGSAATQGAAGGASGGAAVEAEGGAAAEASGSAEKKPAAEGGAEAGDTAASGAAETTGSTSGANTEEGATAKSKSTSESDATASASAEVTVEQKTEIKQVIREVNVEPVQVDFNISVGVAVPQTVVLHPLPPRLVEIVPAYSGYLFFITADGTIIIVAPDSREVVYVIV